MSKRSHPLQQPYAPNAEASLSEVIITSALQHAVELHQQGKLPQAQAFYNKVLQIQPYHFEALHLLGIAASQSGQTLKAVDLIARAIKINPDHAPAHINHGLALQALNRHQAALLSFERALQIDPENSGALTHGCHSLHVLNRDEEALSCYQRILQKTPNNTEVLYNLGNMLHTLSRDEEALASYEQLLRYQPDNISVLNNRGVVLQALHRNEEALTSYDQALLIARDDVLALYNRGNVLRALNRHEEALLCYERVLLVKPDNAEVHNNRGNALRALNRLDKAIASYSRALRSAPHYADAHWNESLCRLLAGDFALGWQKYEWRWQSELKANQRHFKQAQWAGHESLQHKTILIHAEQGLGDTLQFCRYARLVAARGAKVILEVQPELKTLLTGLAGVTKIIAKGEVLPEFDFHCPLLSLPLAFATTLQSIPTECAYISSDPQRVAQWQSQLDSKKAKLNIGLMWRGSSKHKNDHNRSIPLPQLFRLLDDFTPDEARFFALQKELSDADQELLSARKDHIFSGNAIQDFTDTAALIQLMDLVITVDTSVAHLAAAMGKPVWILLPFSPDWRWLLQRENSPWYPSVRLFRQSAIGDWQQVILQVNHALAAQLD